MESDNCEPDEIHLRTGVVTTNYLPCGRVGTNISRDIILTVYVENSANWNGGCFGRIFNHEALHW